MAVGGNTSQLDGQVSNIVFNVMTIDVQMICGIMKNWINNNLDSAFNINMELGQSENHQFLIAVVGAKRSQTGSLSDVQLL